MTVLKSTLNLTSEPARANAAAMSALVADHRALLQTIAAGGGAAARTRHAERGKLLPRQRIDRLIDTGTPFVELSPLAAHRVYADAVPAAGLITGIGRVAGRLC